MKIHLKDYPLSYTRIENGTVVGKGIAFDIFNFLHEKFKFEYTIVLPENNIVGSTDDSAGSIINMLDNDVRLHVCLLHKNMN